MPDIVNTIAHEHLLRRRASTTFVLAQIASAGEQEGFSL